MKPTLINNGLEPPEKRELDREEFEYHALNFVRQYYKMEDVFDTYNHDKEIALKFKTFVSRYMNGEINEDEPDRNINDDDLWDLFCKQ